MMTINEPNLKEKNNDVLATAVDKIYLKAEKFSTTIMGIVIYGLLTTIISVLCFENGNMSDDVKEWLLYGYIFVSFVICIAIYWTKNVKVHIVFVQLLMWSFAGFVIALCAGVYDIRLERNFVLIMCGILIGYVLVNRLAMKIFNSYFVKMWIPLVLVILYSLLAAGTMTCVTNTFVVNFIVCVLATAYITCIWRLAVKNTKDFSAFQVVITGTKLFSPIVMFSSSIGYYGGSNWRRDGREYK